MISALRAALVAALCFSSTTSLAQNKAGKSETHKDIIAKAYNLSLQKDRQQALLILNSAIKKETRPQAVTELKKTASELAQIFLSDKAQQLFEMGISLRKTDPNQALAKLNEASRAEADNSAVVNELARLLIGKNDCSGAKEALSKLTLLLPYDEELKLTNAQALLCQGTSFELNQAVSGVDMKKSPLALFWYSVDIEKAVKEANFVKAQESQTALQKLDPKYPESLYWNWKIAFLQKRKNLESAQKYVMSCKNISASQYRQYMIDPMLCRHLSEVESEIKGLNGTSE
jgi:Putative Zn-dependent protease, contains TPR repeats